MSRVKCKTFNKPCSLTSLCLSVFSWTTMKLQIFVIVQNTYFQVNPGSYNLRQNIWWFTWAIWRSHAPLWWVWCTINCWWHSVSSLVPTDCVLPFSIVFKGGIRHTLVVYILSVLYTNFWNQVCYTLMLQLSISNWKV